MQALAPSQGRVCPEGGRVGPEYWHKRASRVAYRSLFLEPGGCGTEPASTSRFPHPCTCRARKPDRTRVQRKELRVLGTDVLTLIWVSAASCSRSSAQGTALPEAAGCPTSQSVMRRFLPPTAPRWAEPATHRNQTRTRQPDYRTAHNKQSEEWWYMA